MIAERKFSFIMPAELTRSGEEWKIAGLASTASRDQQGEIIDQSGLDLTPIDMKKGLFNWDHKKGPENTIGVIDSYKKSKEGLFLSGRLFKNHTKAKAVYEIMSSLNKADTGRVGLSVEGVIKERAGQDGKIIKKAVIHSCALTMNPVNVDTYASLIKSFADPDADLEFTKDEEVSIVDQAAGPEDTADQPMFSANQVMAILQKALSTGAGALNAPAALTGGDALKVENSQDDDEAREKKAKKVNGHTIDNGGTENGMAKHLKPMSFNLYKSHMFTILNNLQTLYPEFTRSEIWECVKDRLERKFPDLADWEK